MKLKFLSALAPCLSLALLFSGCATTGGGGGAYSREQVEARARMLAEIPNEPRGDYFIARRYYKSDYKFWGYIRRPGEPWSQAKMVMLNENTRLAPDRERGILGLDNGYEYQLAGYFSGETVYEPASNSFYPEFVLKGYELRSKSPAPIYLNVAAALDPARRTIQPPY